MIKFKKVPLDAINWTEAELSAFASNKENWCEKPSNLTASNYCYIPDSLLVGNLKSVIHKAFLYLKPEYRRINNYPHQLIELTDSIITLYD
jgi:hypothetical protein